MVEQKDQKFKVVDVCSEFKASLMHLRFFISYFSHCYGKMPPQNKQTNLKGMSVLAPIVKGQSIIVVKAWWQEGEATNHIVSKVRDQRACMLGLLPHFIKSIIVAHRMEPPTFRVLLLILKLSENTLKHTQS